MLYVDVSEYSVCSICWGIYTPTFLKPSHASDLPAYEDGTECSETSAYKIRTPGNYPEESIQICKCLKWINLRSSLFWDVTHRRLVLSYRRFGMTYMSCLQESTSRLGRRRADR